MYREVLCIKRKEIPMVADGISGGGVSNPFNKIISSFTGAMKTEEESNSSSSYQANAGVKIIPDVKNVDESAIAAAQAGSGVGANVNTVT